MKKLILLIAFLACTGCATNVGRALSIAFKGTPPEVVETIQFVDEKMNRELRMKYEAIYDAPVMNSDGTLNRQAAENRFRDLAITHAEMERWDKLINALAEYNNIELDRNPSASEKAAEKRRKELWKALGESAKDAIKDLD